VTVLADGVVRYAPDADFFGTDTFTYQASDGGLRSAVATVTVTVAPVNDAPVVSPFVAVIDEDTPLSGRLEAADVDGDRLTFALVLEPGQGTVVLNPDGTFLYTPGLDYDGEDAFAFQVSDGQVTTDLASALFIVRPVNDAPVALPNRYPVSPGQTLSITLRPLGVLGNDSDVDDPQGALTAVLVTPTSFGDLVFDANGTFIYRPGPAFATVDTFTYQAVDPAGDRSEVVTVTLTTAQPGFVDAGPAADDGRPDAFRVWLEGDRVQVAVNGTLVLSQLLATAPRLHVQGSGDDDTLVVDLANGSPVPAAGLEYVGGGPGDFDTLTLTGGTAGSVDHTFHDRTSGSVVIDGRQIVYTGLEPIGDEIVAGRRTFTFGPGADDIQLAIGAATTVLTSGSSETVAFENPDDGVVVIDAGGGDATVTVEHAGGVPGFGLVVTGDGRTTVQGEGASLVAGLVTGTEGDDVIRVTRSGAGVMASVNGAERRLDGVTGVTVEGLGGNDRIFLAGALEATVDAGDGDDLVDANNVWNAGVTLRGGAGNDWLRGGKGGDRLEGGAGNDGLHGGLGLDTLLGGDGDDRLAGGHGDDVLDGGDGADALDGWEGDDVLLGAGGNDTLRGGAGNDRLDGEAGADRLDGGRGHDLVASTPGEDAVVPDPDDTLIDWNSARNGGHEYARTAGRPQAWVRRFLLDLGDDDVNRDLVVELTVPTTTEATTPALDAGTPRRTR
jgi:Ca2+-binding RTX toxin-like protein